MQSVRFLVGARAGTRRYLAGELAGISDREVERLLSVGAVEVTAPAPSVEADAEPEKAASPSVTRRRTKPARGRRRKG